MRNILDENGKNVIWDETQLEQRMISEITVIERNVSGIVLERTWLLE